MLRASQRTSLKKLGKRIEKRSLLKSQQHSGDHSTPEGTELAELEEKSISLWRRIAVYFAFLVPFTAAFAKAFTNSFSTLSIFVFCTTGLFIVNPALFAGPVLIVICAMGAATVLVSINMEGRSLYEYLCEELIESPAMRAKRKAANSSNPLAYYITYYFSLPFVWLDEKLEKYFPWVWVNIKKYTAPTLALLMFILSSATKGFAMAPGIFNLLAIIGLSTSGAGAWIIIIIAAIAVMGVSAAKEGKKLLKQLDLWPDPGNSDPSKGPASPLKKCVVCLVAGFLPLTAALAKACGYSYGFLMLLAFIYTGSFAATAAVSAWLPLIIVMAIGVGCVSLRMEGYSLFKLIRRIWIKDEEIPGLYSKYYIPAEKDRIAIRRDEAKAFDRYEKNIADELGNSEKYHWALRRLEQLLSFFCRYIVGWGLPGLTFVAKSSIMMVGTISAIVLLSGGMPITWWLLLIGAIAGLTVGLVSLRKEGVKTHDSVRKYYILFMYKKVCEQEPTAHLEKLELFNKGQQALNSQEIISEEAGRSSLVLTVSPSMSATPTFTSPPAASSQ